MYPEFKIGEIWNDIKDDIKEMGIKVTTDDLNWMMTCIERAAEQAEITILNQQRIAKEFKKKEEGELNNFYKTLQSNR